MRIAYIAAGAGVMYCGACARDATLARGLLARGHEVQLIPLYTPLKLEDDGLPVGPIFYGGINVFLEQAYGIFQRMPAALSGLLDRPGLLRWVAKFALEVEPRKLGPMTVSVLAGKDGRQAKEAERLLAYLESGFRPELVNLTNSLLSGLAPELKRRLQVPVVCTFQGEDQFVADLPEPHRARALALIRENAQSIDLVICPSAALAPSVAAFLGVPPVRLRVIHTAVPLGPQSPRQADAVARPFTIGYLSVIKPSKGLDLLVEALRLLAQQGRDMHLRVAGRIMDKAFWRTIQQTLRQASLDARFAYVGEVDAPGKADFLNQCSVFCVPSRYPEPRGVAVLEAMAAGVPVIVPESGVFPELLALGGGGVPTPTGDAAALARAVASMMDQPDQTTALGKAARQLIAQHCAPAEMVERTLREYERMVGNSGLVKPPQIVNE